MNGNKYSESTQLTAVFLRDKSLINRVKGRSFFITLLSYLELKPNLIPASQGRGR